MRTLRRLIIDMLTDTSRDTQQTKVGCLHPEPIDQEDNNNYDVAKHEFGWDNESPQRIVNVDRFRISWRPVTNGEFRVFWEGEGKGIVKLPASWRVNDESGEVEVSLSLSVFLFEFWVWSS